MPNPLDEIAGSIFRVKGSNPEHFGVAFSDPSVKMRGYTGDLRFMTAEQVRELLRTGKSEAEIDYIIEQARRRER
jgi:hypothetical protein